MGKGKGKGEGKKQEDKKSYGPLARNLFYSGAVDNLGLGDKKKWEKCSELARGWEKKQKDVIVVKTEYTLEELEKSFLGAAGDLRGHFGDDYSSFERYKSSSMRHIMWLSRDGRVVAYKKTVPEQLAKRLGRAVALLPEHAPHPAGEPVFVETSDDTQAVTEDANATPAANPAAAGPAAAPGAPTATGGDPPPGRARPSCPGSRGAHRVQHLAMWADYGDDSKPRISKDMRWLDRKHNGAGREFVKENEELIKMVTNDHMFLVPQEHARAVNAAKKIKKEFGIEPLFLGWYGAAVIQGMNGEEASEVHRDMKDYGLSCVVPFGDYDGGDLVLVQLGVKVELRPGDVFFFRSSIVAHQVEEVIGVRGALTLFTHANTFAWADRTKALDREKLQKKWPAALPFRKMGKERKDGKVDYRNYTAELEEKRLEEKEKRREKKRNLRAKNKQAQENAE